MASNDQPAQPDLASILRTLASLAPQTQPQQDQPTAYGQPSSFTSHFQPSQQSWVPPAEQVSSIPRSTTPSEPPPQTSVADPSTITEWSAGLKCVMRTVVKHESILNDIRKMMKNQRDHEEEWWNGRQNLVEKQKARKEGQQKLDDVLKAVGGAVTPGFASNHSDDHTKELKTFDMKVYKAQMQMVKEMTAKLRSLGVPFFGTRSDLVIPNGKEANAVSGTADRKDEKGTIDEIELMKLQRKMLIILEDLCSD
ncbi:hypothetical protein ONS95_004856 [Cadophora gregata]|uniref:uncharacterized protein n=1 Tax=Cadophora gregata TaxID=51156 RepID=UPI0026DBB5D0|nr:uncharacterized protein ONS95_004856 [Cadophora gregata]KAK0104570.1 hypothetical protein ONS95_004856 [Cadophora gregata]KAK0115341.1 hypothetical protein ONS96_013800 [Cadophora gregata f. sp. sojae]